MAVAGFSESDLEITLKQSALVVSGRAPKDETPRQFLHRGIARRAFERRFELADHIVVDGATLENGLLHIALRRVVPRLPNFAEFAHENRHFTFFTVQVGSGIEAVPRSMVESAEALGYTRLQIFRYVVLPLGFRICLPALNNNLVKLVKTTSQAFAIAVPEILYVAVQIYTDRLNVWEMMVVMLLTYVSIVAFLVWAMGRWERSLRIPGYSV